MGTNLQTFSSACPLRRGLTCPEPQPRSQSPNQSPGDRRRRHSCAGRRLALGSGRRANESEGGLRPTRRVWAHLLPPCHPPDATVLLEDSRNKELRGKVTKLWCIQQRFNIWWIMYRFRFFIKSVWWRSIFYCWYTIPFSKFHRMCFVSCQKANRQIKKQTNRTETIQGHLTFLAICCKNKPQIVWLSFTSSISKILPEILMLSLLLHE